MVHFTLDLSYSNPGTILRFTEAIDKRLDALQMRYGQRRINTLATLLIIGIASVTIRLLMAYEMHRSAVLYLAVPYAVAILITLMRPYQRNDNWWQRYFSHTVSALVVFLGSSIVLFEGFICVLFFMPIYFGVVSIAFIVQWIAVSWQDRKSRTLATAIPLLVMLLSLEGTSEPFSLARENTVTATVITHKSTAELFGNLASPFDLRKERHWLLSLFPMPYEIQAGSLVPGDIHVVHTRYHRWFVANTYEGEMRLLIERVGPDTVSVRYLSDTSYFSSYLTLVHSRIQMKPAGNSTQVSLHIHYERELHPAWYFQPIQRFAVARMAEFLLQEVVIRD